jgi:FkbM family methyltransferase
MTTDKARVGELEARLAAAHDKIERARERLSSVTNRLHRYERAFLDPDVLAHLLPGRAARRRARPPDPADAARDARHLESSPSYREAVDLGAPPSAGADRVSVQGLEFWIPRDRRIPGRLADDLLHGRLPLADLLRTREAIGGGVMLDVGANIGTTSIPRAVLGDYSTIYCAEPEPDNFACLVRSVIENGLRGVVLPDRCALSDRDGRTTLVRSASIGGHRLDDEGTGGIEVDTYTLESWLRRLRVTVDDVQFIKLDTQGREAHILAGAGAVAVRAGIVWQLEFSPRHLRQAGTDPAAFVAHLTQTFSYFVDLFEDAPGDRLRPIAELGEGLAYLDESFTDILVYRVSQ